MSGANQTSAADQTQAGDVTKPQTAPTPGKTLVAPDTPEVSAEPVTGEAKPGTEEPKVPEKYELKLPDNTLLEARHLESVSSYAKEKGLTQEQAQALLEREHQAVQDYNSKLADLQKENARIWEEQAKADSELGGNNFNQSIEMAKRVVQKFGSEKFIKDLNETGFGNHPELLRVFARIGKAMDEDTFIRSTKEVSKVKESPAEILYGRSA